MFGSQYNRPKKNILNLKFESNLVIVEFLSFELGYKLTHTTPTDIMVKMIKISKSKKS